jgi:glycosyltransferase involved in cell wall biosynthesis
MNILVLQETDWLTRGPHTQHHVFENISQNIKINVTVLDYDIDKILKSNSVFIKKQIYKNTSCATDASNVKILRTSHLQIPYLRRITSLITNFKEILKIIRHDRPDVIVGFSMTNGFIGLLLAKLFKIPYIFYYIDVLHQLVPISYVQEIAKIITRFSFKFADQVIIQTKFHYNLALNEGAKPEKIKLLPDGITLKNTVVDLQKLKTLKKRFSLSENDFVIFFMGFLYDFAGLKEIIDYYHKDVEEGKLNLKFIILGDGGIYSSLKNYTEQIQATWVFLEGRVPFFNVTEYIELADLCLMSFKINDITREIIPIKIFEYMAMKKPVLSNALPSVVYEIGNNNGVIFAKNQEVLIKRIKEFIPLKEELIKIGQRGFEIVKKKYTWSNIIEEFKKVIINLLEKKKKKKKNK